MRSKTRFILISFLALISIIFSLNFSLLAKAEAKVHDKNQAKWAQEIEKTVVGEERTQDEGEVDDKEDSITTDPKEWTFHPNDDGSGLPMASIRCVTPDNQGGIWVGTYGGGAAYKNSQGDWTVYDTTNSQLPDNTVYDIALDQEDKIWMAVGGAESPKGVICKDGDTWTIYDTENSDLPNNFVFTITTDNNGGVWFGTGRGAAHRDSDGTWTVYDKESGIPANSVNVIVPDGIGGVWFGCYPDTIDREAGLYSGGYAYLDPSGKWKLYSDEDNTNFGDNWVRSISLDKGGGAWISRSGNTAGGGKVDYISPAGRKQTYDDEELYPDLPEGDTIRLVAADQYGGLWLGTKSSGILYRKKDGQITATYNSSNGWPSAKWDNVYFLEAANGAIWVGTNGGVAYKAWTGDGGTGPIPEKEVILTVEGPGVNNTAEFSLEELKQEKYGRVRERYFSLNSFGTREYYDFEGISLAHLLDNMVDLEDDAESAEIMAVDGYYRLYNLDDIRKDYLDENNPSKNFPMILAWMENGEELDDSNPLKLVVGQTEVGDINKPNWVANVEKITVNTYSVVSGAGPEGNYLQEIPVELMGTVDLSKAVELKKIKLADGRTAEIITVQDTAEKILKQYQNEANIVLTTSAEVETVIAEIPAAVWQAAEQKKMTFEISSAAGTFLLPADAILLDDVAKELDVNKKAIKVNITVDGVSEQTLENLTLKGGQKLMVKPVEFKIELKAKGKQKEWNSFDQRYITRQIQLKENVNWDQCNGVVWNQNKGNFSAVPTKFETRVDGKTYAVILSRTNGIYSVMQYQKSFADLDNHRAAKDIETLASKLIVSGKSDTTYEPLSQVTRAEFASLLARALALEDVDLELGTYKDVTGSEWYVKSVGAAVNEGLIKGYSDGTFQPNKTINREEMAVMLVRATQIADKENNLTDDQVEQALASFTDRQMISGWAKRDFVYALQAGIINGLSEGKVSPQAQVDRAQCASAIKNFMQYIGFLTSSN